MGKGEYPFLLMFSFSLDINYLNFVALRCVYSCGILEQEGHKPCQIINPQLTVGGHILEGASNGNTNIMINNRQITKAELIMLQVAMLDTIWFFYMMIFLSMQD